MQGPNDGAQLLGLVIINLYITCAIGCKLCSKESLTRPLYPVLFAFTCFVAYLELYVSGRDNLVWAFGDFALSLFFFRSFPADSMAAETKPFLVRIQKVTILR